jgi:hypothetical protein
MIKASTINTNEVTGEQIGKCRKWTDNSRTSFYLVENSRGDLDPETFEVIEYKVTHDEKGFHCTCKAGQMGFAHCKLGVCAHVVWSVACEKELREAMKLIEAEIAAEKAIALAAQQEKEEEERKALAAKELAAKYPRAAKGDLQSKPFSLMR